jgi:hypothetical protein
MAGMGGKQALGHNQSAAHPEPASLFLPAWHLWARATLIESSKATHAF